MHDHVLALVGLPFCEAPMFHLLAHRPSRVSRLSHLGLHPGEEGDRRGMQPRGASLTLIIPPHRTGAPQDEEGDRAVQSTSAGEKREPRDGGRRGRRWGRGRGDGGYASSCASGSPFRGWATARA